MKEANQFSLIEPYSHKKSLWTLRNSKAFVRISCAHEEVLYRFGFLNINYPLLQDERFKRSIEADRGGREPWDEAGHLGGGRDGVDVDLAGAVHRVGGQH